MTRQQREFYHDFSRHGSGAAAVEIQGLGIDGEVVALLAHIAYFDIYNTHEAWFADWAVKLIDKDFYSITQSEIFALPEISEDEAFEFLEKAKVTDVINYVYMYLKNLAALYRRRFKFYNILREQPFPSVEQVGLRCLLESRAGKEMGRFIVKYIKPPIMKMKSLFAEIPAGISLSATNSVVEIKGDGGRSYYIERTPRDKEVDS